MAKRKIVATKIEPDICFECGAPAYADHFVVPRSMGGTKSIPLCYACYEKVHTPCGLRTDRRAESVSVERVEVKSAIGKMKDHPLNIFFWIYVTKFEEREGRLTRCCSRRYQKLADELNALGQMTATGQPYTASYCKFLVAQMRAKEL